MQLLSKICYRSNTSGTSESQTQTTDKFVPDKNFLKEIFQPLKSVPFGRDIIHGANSQLEENKTCTLSPSFLLLQLLRLHSVRIYNRLQCLKARTTPPRSVSLPQMCILASNMTSRVTFPPQLLSNRQLLCNNISSSYGKSVKLLTSNSQDLL